MRRKLVAAASVWLLTATGVVAADFWVEKDFTTWSDKEVEKMMTDSPWAKQVRIIVSGGLAEGEGPQLIPQGTGVTGGQPSRATQFDRIQRAEVTVTWASSVPIKQATVRQMIGLDAPMSAAGQQVLDRPEPAYVVIVTDLPTAFSWLAGTGDVLKSETALLRKGKAPIAPVDVRLFNSAQTQSLTLVMQFPRTDPITLDDKDVEVVTKLGVDEIKKKFKLSDMVFAGELAL